MFLLYRSILAIIWEGNLVEIGYRFFLQLSETSHELMDFLSRSWNMSALEVSKALALTQM